jgi:nucleoside-diphosphate-sugar epimerase
MLNGNVLNRVALVTGATGFIGEHLCKTLINRGWDVHALVRSTSNVRRLELLGDSVHLHKIGSSGTQEIIDVVGAVMPDSVFHLAATQLSEHSHADIDALLESNIRLGTQILEAMHIHGVGVFINTGTYWQHYAGRDYDPVSLYAACKKAFQDLIVYYRNVRKIKATTLLLTDTYGEEDIRKKILTLLVEASITGNLLDLSPGEQNIDLIHVSDVVNAFIYADKLLKSAPQYEEVYSVSSGRHGSIQQLAKLVEKFTGEHINAKWGARSYQPRQIMTVTMTEPMLPNWHASVSLEEGISRITDAIKLGDGL